MSSLQKNVASQHIKFGLIIASSGAADTGATASGVVTKDGGAQASCAGTFTNLGSGQYDYAPTQAETNATDVGFLFTATGDIPVSFDFHTDIVDANGLLKVDVEDWNATAVSSPSTAGIPDINVKNINNVVAATPGATGGILIAGTNAATTIDALTLTGTAASGATPATAGLTVTGGAASTSSGGTSAAAIKLTGGAGAASTNGAAAGLFIAAGGTTTVSGNDGAVFTGTGNGNGVTMTHAGSGLDLNAQTTNALQVNATAINAVSTSSVTTVNANIGTTQPINFTGTAGSALVKSDMQDIAGSAVSATSAQIGVNVVNWNNTVVATPATAGIPDINVKNINNVSASSVTTINANIGETQPINFTGSGASALVKSDMTDIAGSAVSTSSAQIGVNLVNIAGSAVSTSSAQLGVNVVSVAGGASNIKKNQALSGFQFLMTDSTNHAPSTGLTVTGTVSKDGGAFGSLTNSVTEIANGWYTINLAAADLNGNNIALRFTATASDDRDIYINTQP